MILISHRGNINGREVLKENTIPYINSALEYGFNVEIDVQKIENGQAFIGHDGINDQICLDFLKNKNLWCHAKTIESFYIMLKNNIHCFWHEQDTYTLTSFGYIWAFPTAIFPKNVVAVLPEKFNTTKKDLIFQEVIGVCSDYIYLYK